MEKCDRRVLHESANKPPAREAIIEHGRLPAFSDEHFPEPLRREGIRDGDFDPYGQCDWRWVVCKLAEWDKLANHEFNPEPARSSLGERARLILFSDWASGIPRAKALTKIGMPKALAGIGSGYEMHAIHLGDTYYIGDSDEQRQHVLDLWPALGEAVGAWALPGNHDYYSGGDAFFDVLLADPRFQGQRSNGNPTTLFELSNSLWRVIGLDTGWLDHDLPPAGWKFLEAALAEAKAANQRVELLSHHQQHSPYSSVPEGFASRAASLLVEYPVAAGEAQLSPAVTGVIRILELLLAVEENILREGFIFPPLREAAVTDARGECDLWPRLVSDTAMLMAPEPCPRPGAREHDGALFPRRRLELSEPSVPILMTKPSWQATVVALAFMASITGIFLTVFAVSGIDAALKAWRRSAPSSLSSLA